MLLLLQANHVFTHFFLKTIKVVMHFVLLLLGNAIVSNYNASFACASQQSNCSKAMMFLFLMLFKPPNGFYVMFMLLLMVVQLFQAMMFILLMLPSSPIVPSYDVLLACDFCHALLFSNPMALSDDALLDHASWRSSCSKL